MVGNVLLVEDNRIEAELLDEYLELYGLEVERVTDGSFALERLRDRGSRPPDSLILDLNLPMVSGYEILRAIKLDPQLRPRRVIVTSRLKAKNEIDVCMYMGADAYVQKNDDPILFANDLWNALAAWSFRSKSSKFA
jgi:CheY-like chemotaxis protein